MTDSNFVVEDLARLKVKYCQIKVSVSANKLTLRERKSNICVTIAEVEGKSSIRVFPAILRIRLPDMVTCDQEPFLTGVEE